MHIIKYKKDIQNIVKHVCYCCQRCFLKFQNFFASKSYIKKLPNAIQDIKTNDRILICKSCWKKIDLQKPLDLTLWNHIMNNEPNMKYVLTLNKI
jgi:hypothetical protein